MTTDKREQAINNLRKWKANPISFVQDVFKCEPDLWQRDVLFNFADKQRIAMQASKGVGKTTTLAWCIWNFLLTRLHPKIAVTSISADNLRDGLWAEMSKWYAKSPLLREMFVVTKTKIFAKEAPETWFCSARTWSKSADSSQQADALAGLHADYMLFLMDEAGGIPDSVMATAEAALASGIETKLVIAGNPTHLEGPLYRAATNERHLWHLVKISSDPDNPNRSTRVSIQWAKEQIEKYGKDNNWVRVNVFGEFPSSSLNTLLGVDEVESALGKHLLEDQYNFSQKRLGVDVARFGDDRCFDDQTEILTDEGWKLFQDLNGKEKVFTIKGDKATWGAILHIHKAWFDGELNSYSNRSIDFCVTDNHRMFVRKNPKSDAYMFKPYKDLAKNFVIREENGWAGSNVETRMFTSRKRMPHGGHCITTEAVFDFNDWAEFLGWFVSEGNVYCEKRKHCRKRIVLTQYKGAKRNHLEALLTKMNIRWRASSNGTQIEFYNLALADWLIETCGQGAVNKRIPKEIKEASEKAIKRFLDGFLMGDGTCRKDGKGRTYITSSKQLADDLQELLVKLGRAGSLRKKNLAGSEFYIGTRKVIRKNDTYVLYERRSFGKNISKSDVKKTPYKGYVWCVATPYESILVRRNGKPMWSGNTVIFPRQGLAAFTPVEMRGARSNEIAARVMAAKAKWNSEVEMVDGSGGWGSGVVDSLLQAGCSPLEISFSGKPIDNRFFNKRAEMWFTMAEWIKRGGALPRLSELVKELTTVQYTFQNGKFRLEEKDQIKERIGFSPDYADALALTFAIPDQPAANPLTRLMPSKNKLEYDYDPFDNSRM